MSEWRSVPEMAAEMSCDRTTVYRWVGRGLLERKAIDGKTMVRTAAWDGAHDDADSYVYFIQEEGGLVKIGVAKDPDRRLKDLRAGNPRELVLLGTMRGGRDVEFELHNTFASYRERGEWFRPTKVLIAMATARMDHAK